MTYTYNSAAFANISNTAVIANTVEAGAVALSQVDHPVEWQALLDSGVVISPYVDSGAPERTRVQTFKDDATQADLLNRLKTATSDQIDTWLTNNVTNLAQARTVLGAIVKFLAARGLFG